MYDVKRFASSPSTARKLIGFSKLNGMAISDEIKALASQNLIGLPHFANGAVTPSETQIKAIQYIVDWGYRSVVLYNTPDGKDTALLSAQLNNEYPIVIITRTEKFTEWSAAVSKILPDKKTNIVPYSKTNKGTLPANHTAGLKVEEGNDIIITNSSALFRNDILDIVNPKMIICDEYESNKSFGYSNVGYVSGLLKEFKKVLMLQNTCFLAQEKMDINTLLNFSFMNRNNHHLANIVNNIIIPENNLLLNFEFAEDILHKYYDGFDNSLFLQAFGISTHLVYDRDRTSPVVGLRFYNDSISKLSSMPERNGVKSALRNHLQKEQEISKLSRKSVREVMEHFVEGGANEYAMNELYTHEWCELKYKEIARLFLNNYSNSSKRMLFVATNPTLVKTFTTNTPKIIHYETAKSRINALQEYIGVDKDPLDFFNQNARFMLMGPNSMVNEDILKRTNYMVMAQYPTSAEEFAKVIEVCAKYRITLVDIVLQGSFEEYLVDELYRKLNI